MREILSKHRITRSPEFPPPFLFHDGLHLLGPGRVLGETSLFLEIGTEAFVALNDVLSQPGFEKMQQFEGDRDVFLIKLALKIMNFMEQILMLLFMNGESRVTRDPHQAFLKQEMGGGVLCQTVKNLARRHPAHLPVDRVVQLVEETHQGFVLFVDFLNADGVFVAPGKKFGILHCSVYTY